MGSDAATWLKNYVLTAPITKGDKEESHKMPCCKCNMLKVREVGTQDIYIIETIEYI